MDPQVAGELIAQAPSLAFGLLIIWFVLRLFDRYDRERSKIEARFREERMARDEDWRKWLDGQSEAHREFVQTHAEDARLFFKEYRGAQSKAIGRIAEEVKSNTNALVNLSTLLVDHDKRAQTFMRDVRKSGDDR